MKKWYSAKELAGMAGMPKTESAVIRKAKKEKWLSMYTGGRGGGREYYLESLPEETRDDLFVGPALKCCQ